MKICRMQRTCTTSVGHVADKCWSQSRVYSKVILMDRLLPGTFDSAVDFGLGLLDEQSRAELAEIGYVDPHTKYRVDYIALIGSSLGIWDESNTVLLESLAASQSESLHFFDFDGEKATPDGAVRIILKEMARRA